MSRRPVGRGRRPLSRATGMGSLACSMPDAAPLFGPVTLTGRHVQLVPLSADHADGLMVAVQDGRVWELWYTAVPSPDGMAAEVDRRLRLQAGGSMVPFAVLDGPGGRVVGMTTFMNIDVANRRVEVGSTWYAARVRRTGLNTEAKLLLLGHAFDALACIAVELRTHAMNRDSRRAIERLGAKLDGVLRSHQVSRNGTLRDTAVYSVTAAEWPTVRANLRWQLDRPR